MSVPVPVTIASSGFTWTAALVAILNVLVGGALVAFIRSRVPMKKVAADREANLLKERADEMAIMRKQLAELEAERAMDRHRINNLSQCLDALLLLIEQDPSKAAAAAAKIREMRADQLKREAAEKATIRAAGIAAVDAAP